MAEDELSRHVGKVEEIVSALLGEDTQQGLEDGHQPDPETVQRLMRTAVKLYVAARVADPELAPFTGTDVNATEVAITSQAMLRAVQMEVFELGLWGSWGS